jgi:hypothetical protein
MANEPNRVSGPHIFQLLGGDIRVWIEQEAIHMIANDRRHNDPVELTGKEARHLAATLIEMANRLNE